MAFTKKSLRFTFDLPGDRTFDPAGNNRLTLSGLRASATISQAGSMNLGDCDIEIYGMTLSQMNRLTTLGQKIQWVRRNVVTVEAGDERGMSVVYQGIIVDGWADFASPPNAVFRIGAHAAADWAVQPIPPTTIRGSADVATIMSGLAQQMRPPLHFQNNGVNVRLSDPYLPGTVLEQIHRCAEHAGINWTIDRATGSLAIWPKGASRGDLIPEISAKTGMIGVPSFTSKGVQVTSIFNPSILFGQKIKVTSILPDANKEWNVLSITHSLDTITPGGQWHTRIIGTWPDQFSLSPALR